MCVCMCALAVVQARRRGHQNRIRSAGSRAALGRLRWLALCAACGRRATQKAPARGPGRAPLIEFNQLFISLVIVFVVRDDVVQRRPSSSSSIDGARRKQMAARQHKHQLARSNAPERCSTLRNIEPLTWPTGRRGRPQRESLERKRDATRQKAREEDDKSRTKASIGLERAALVDASGTAERLQSEPRSALSRDSATLGAGRRLSRAAAAVVVGDRDEPRRPDSRAPAPARGRPRARAESAAIGPRAISIFSPADLRRPRAHL
jgi:hypothetical protein